MILIGIDIGLTGAICAIDPHGVVQVNDLPVLRANGDKRISAAQLIMMLRALAPVVASAMIVAEDVRVQPIVGRQMRMSSETKLIEARGIILAVAEIARIPVHLVQPQKWKRSFGLIGKDKEASRQMALALFPHARADLSRMKDHNRAESVLIARWGQLNLA